MNSIASFAVITAAVSFLVFLATTRYHQVKTRRLRTQHQRDVQEAESNSWHTAWAAAYRARGRSLRPYINNEQYERINGTPFKP